MSGAIAESAFLLRSQIILESQPILARIMVISRMFWYEFLGGKSLL